jgi:amidase
MVGRSLEIHKLMKKKFEVVEATIADIHQAMRSGEITATDLVTMYLARIRAFNGPCVSEPEGILGPAEPIAHAGGINALVKLNLRPAARRRLGFDDRKARSLTDSVDDDPNMPDALETAAAARVKRTPLTGAESRRSFWLT